MSWSEIIKRGLEKSGVAKESKQDDILAAVKALIDDSIKGVLRSIGDAGDSPYNTRGYTVLYWLDRIADHAERIRSFTTSLKDAIVNPAHAETYTTAALAANATYTSPSKDFQYSRLSSFNILGYSDVDSATDGVQIQQSVDGSHWDYAYTQTATGGAGVAMHVAQVARYGRAVWINGATAQSEFRFGGRYSISASEVLPMKRPLKQSPPPEKYFTETVKVKDPLTGEEVEEEHIFLLCEKCSRKIDTLVEGFFGHSQVVELVLCRSCYIKLAFGVTEKEYDEAERRDRRRLMEIVKNVNNDFAREWLRG